MKFQWRNDKTLLIPTYAIVFSSVPLFHDTIFPVTMYCGKKNKFYTASRPDHNINIYRV